MRFVADLHIHSKYSRACSRDCDLEHLAWWAGRKGVAVVGTGDLCHPGWGQEIRAKLVPAEPGLFRLRPDLERDVLRRLPAACRTPVRFLLSVEISTIYKRADRTRKVHHLLYVPDLAAADDLTRRLARVGNIASDGRPILGLDSRDLLDITLSTSDSSYLVPAHLWTPWFAVLGSKSGFDSVAGCYADLADHVFAVETGLSSDPAMNWRVSALDRYRLVSNSDAHSPPMLGREATLFDTDIDYWAMLAALRTGEGLAGTVEFFPEEGKYHADGHRRCEVRLDPAETRARGGRCPACGAALTVGVLHRVEALADRPYGRRPAGAAPFHSLVQLPQIVGEIRGVGPKSRSVQADVADLVDRLGPELAILTEIPLDAIEREGSAVLAEAVRRLRRGEVIREAGYDGEYGVIRLFDPKELADFAAAPGLFDAPAPLVRSSPPQPAGGPEIGAGTAAMAAVSPSGPAVGLDPDQRAAAEALDGPVLVVAGPGTGKTGTLTHRIARLVTDRGVPPEQCLAITFTRRASEEMRERLAGLLPGQAARVLVTTFHGHGLRILRENADRCGLTADFRVADETARLAMLREARGRAGPPVDARRLLAEASRLSRALAAGPPVAADGWRMPAGTAGSSHATPVPVPPGETHPADAAPAVAGDGVDEEWVGPLARYKAAKRARNLVDLDDLLALPVGLLAADPALAGAYRARWPWVSVDEYQDVDATQYRLLRLLCPPDGNLCAIGDPDQAIYRFRGADVGFFLRFRADFPSARVIELTRNYRSSAAIVRAALGAVAPATLVPGRVLMPCAAPPDAPERLVLHSAADERAEAAYVVGAIDRLLGGSSFHSLDTGRVEPGHAAAHSFADFAILYRTDAQSLALVDALEAAGLPYQKLSHHRLGEQPGVRDVLAALRAAAGSSPRPVAALLRAAAQSAIEAAGGLQAVADPGSEPLADGMDPALRIGQIRAAVELLSPLAERAGADLDRFLGEIALGAEVDLWDPRADRVSLLTLHAAKGLEFPVVFIVGCEDGLLPFRWGDLASRDDAGGEIDEERRLLFVGLTRARTHLVLTHARRRTWRGASRDMAPSRFLADIDPSLLERTSGAARPRTVQLRLL